MPPAALPLGGEFLERGMPGFDVIEGQGYRVAAFGPA